MRKNVFGRQLKRDTNERKALFKGLLSSFVLNDRITTTEQKAKSVKGQMEKLVTKARKKGDSALDQFQLYLTMDAARKLVSDIAPRFADRPGGYTRLIKIGKRFNDNASMVIMEWVEGSSKVKVPASRQGGQDTKLDKKTAVSKVKKKKEEPKAKVKKVRVAKKK